MYVVFIILVLIFIFENGEIKTRKIKKTHTHAKNYTESKIYNILFKLKDILERKTKIKFLYTETILINVL